MIKDTVGPYEITEKLGQGGMGAVYKATHKKINQVVAIKILHPSYSEDNKMQDRFIKEASIQAKFSHPNIVDVLNYFEDKNDKFMVLEYIDGTTLEEKLKKSGYLSIEESISISKQVLNALDFLHSRGVVHRDIKPSNIMFDRNETVKVTDFGTAKVLGDLKNTKTGLVGSYAYMSPEQILGEEVTEVSDIYSFGITLYRMVTGRLPFENESEYKVMKGHLEQKPAPPWVINKNVPTSLGNIILKSLSKNPDSRFHNVKELSAALSNLNQNEGFISNYLLSKKVAVVIVSGLIIGFACYLLINPGSGNKNLIQNVNKEVNPSILSVHAEEGNEEVLENVPVDVTNNQNTEIIDKEEEVIPEQKIKKVKKTPPGLKKKKVIPPGQVKKWRIRK
ncbi:MAG: serine/threonine-protein kinase [Thermodesulfobacteriota bacterium]